MKNCFKILAIAIAVFAFSDCASAQLGRKKDIVIIYEQLSSDASFKQFKKATKMCQIENLNAYETVQAETMSNQSKNISVSGVGNTTVKAKKGDWIKVSGVDLSNGVSSITVKGSGNAVVKFCVGSTTGTCIGYGELNGSENVLAAAENNVNGVKDIYMVFSGDCEFDYWKLA